MRDAPRTRRPVSASALRLLRPLFRYSPGRDAYVLRLAQGRYGPVLVERDRPEPPSIRTGRFDRAGREATDAEQTRAPR